MGNSVNFTLGLDLAQDSFDAAMAPEGADVKDWRALAHTHLPAAPDSAAGVEALRQWLAALAPEGRCARIVVESTGALSRRVAYALNQVELGGVAIVNPRRSKAFGDSLGVRDKNDRIDCAILALYGLVHAPAPTPLRSADEEELRELTRLRQSLVADRTAWLSRLSEASSPLARRTINVAVKSLQKQISQLERRIDQHLEQQEVLRFQVESLKRIPEIGATTAHTLTAELGDLRLYTRGQLVALAGMYPKEFSSGTSVRHRPRLAKGGGGRLRRVLYMCATSLFHSKGTMRAWIQRKLDQGREPMVVETMVMRKLLLVARAVMLAGGHFDPSRIGTKEVLAL
jgi:transposase